MVADRTILRQGDVLLLPVDTAPACGAVASPENGRVVLAHGEATGHHHSFAFSDRVALFREDGAGGGLFLTVSPGPAVALEHQEHSALQVQPGAYRVLRQRTMTSGVARRVVD